MTRKFEKGDKCSTIVTVTKVKKDVPTVIEVDSPRYILEHKRQRSKNPVEAVE